MSEAGRPDIIRPTRDMPGAVPLVGEHGGGFRENGDKMIFDVVKKRLACLAWLSALLVALMASGASAQDNMLWSVEDGVGSKLFLYGSIHMATPDTYPLPAIVEQAFANSVNLVVEADVTDPGMTDSMLKILTGGEATYLKSGKDLWSDIGPSMSEGLKACAGSHGLPVDLFTQLKPWLAAVTLEAVRLKALGYDENLGLDRHFLVEAKEKGIGVYELESMEEQMGIFTSMTEKESKLFLQASVLECESGPEEIHKLIDVWRRGDLEGFEAIYFQVYKEYPELSTVLDKVIFDRNDRMHERLQRYLVPGQTSFVVIGAAHMVGSRGLPEKFRAQGMKVTRY